MAKILLVSHPQKSLSDSVNDVSFYGIIERYVTQLISFNRNVNKLDNCAMYFYINTITYCCRNKLVFYHLIITDKTTNNGIALEEYEILVPSSNDQEHEVYATVDYLMQSNEEIAYDYFAFEV